MTQPMTIKPVGGAHAIEAMVMAVEWSPGLEPSRLQQVAQAHERIRDRLPAVALAKGFRVELGPEGVREEGHADGLDYSTAQVPVSGRPDWVVSLRQNFVTCSCGNYERWASVKPAALSLLMPFVELAASMDVKIAAVGLEYLDGFTLPRVSRPELFGNLIRRGSPWLPPSVYSHDSLWHVHQGWFTESKKGRRVLNVVNVDLLEEGDDYRIKIHGQHRVLSSSYKTGQQSWIGIEDVDGALDRCHQLNKDFLLQLLADPTLELIGMKGGI